MEHYIYISYGHINGTSNMKINHSERKQNTYNTHISIQVI
jgi:hypothetical protein